MTVLDGVQEDDDEEDAEDEDFDDSMFDRLAELRRIFARSCSLCTPYARSLSLTHTHTYTAHTAHILSRCSIASLSSAASSPGLHCYLS